LFPAGEARFERRGEDAVTDDDGKSKRLERYALNGIAWGRETLWFDDARHLAVAKMVDDEFVPAGIGAVHAVEAGFDGINHLSFVTRALFPPAYDPDKVLDQRGGEPGATGALRRPHSFTGWAARAGAWRSRPSAAIDVPRSGHSLQPLRNVTDCALRPARLLLCASHDG
jgi:hypothetical protein